MTTRDNRSTLKNVQAQPIQPSPMCANTIWTTASEIQSDLARLHNEICKLNEILTTILAPDYPVEDYKPALSETALGITLEDIHSSIVFAAEKINQIAQRIRL